MSHPFSDPREFARHLRRAATPAEELLWQLLRNRQCCHAKFRRQHSFGIYTLDFYCIEAKLVVECDGAPHFTEEGIAKDAIRTDWLRKQGLEVLRFTSHQIENDTQNVLATIASLIEQRRTK